MSNELGLGKLITTEQHRDAIHVAVAPVAAAHRLSPGDHVGLDGEGRASEQVKDYIGIVDPFIKGFIDAGERFWLFLYPQTVTGMRHEWSHPAFKEEAPKVNLATLDEKQQSEMWLRVYAKNHNTYDSPEDAFANLLDGLKSGELFFHGTDLHGLYDVDDAEELKEHAERYLGIKVNWEHFTFSCSC